MKKVPLGHHEKVRLLWQKLKSLEIQLNAFDMGERYVAPEIATILYVILVNDGKNQSLLYQVGQDGLPFRTNSSFRVSSENLLPENSLISIRTRKVPNGSLLTDFEPIETEDYPGTVDKLFLKPWLKELIAKDLNGQKWSRKEIIRQVRNLEGAHSDAKVSGAFRNLKHGNPFGMALGIQSSEDSGPAYSAVYATLRQIAGSALESLRDDLTLTDSNSDQIWP